MPPSRASSRLSLLDLPGRVETAQAWIQSIPDDGLPLLNVPTLRAGDWPGIEARDEVVVNEPFAEANGYVIGDTLRGDARRAEARR